LLGARGRGLPGKRSAPRTPRVTPSLGALAIPTPRESSVVLATSVHLPIKGRADVRIGQFLKINISLTIAKN